MLIRITSYCTSTGGIDSRYTRYHEGRLLTTVGIGAFVSPCNRDEGGRPRKTCLGADRAEVYRDHPGSVANCGVKASQIPYIAFRDTTHSDSVVKYGEEDITPISGFPTRFSRHHSQQAMRYHYTYRCPRIACREKLSASSCKASEQPSIAFRMETAP